jgi:hypothetical protein
MKACYFEAVYVLYLARGLLLLLMMMIVLSSTVFSSVRALTLQQESQSGSLTAIEKNEKKAREGGRERRRSVQAQYCNLGFSFVLTFLQCFV